MPFSFISNILNGTATTVITLVNSSSWSAIAVLSAVGLIIPAYQIFRGYMIRFRTHDMLKYAAYTRNSKKEVENILSSKWLISEKKVEALIHRVDTNGNTIFMGILEDMVFYGESLGLVLRGFYPALRGLTSEEQFSFLSRQNVVGCNVIMLAIQNRDALLLNTLIGLLAKLTPNQKYIILSQRSYNDQNLLIQSVRSEISPDGYDSNDGFVQSFITATQGLTLEQKLALLNMTTRSPSMTAQNFARGSERLTRILADFEFSYEAAILEAGAVLRQLSLKTRMPLDIAKLLVTFIDSGPQAACLLTGFNRARLVTNRRSAGTVPAPVMLAPAMRFVASVADEDSTEERKYPPCLRQRSLN